MNDVAFDMLAVRPEERVLEVGFGGGALLAKLLASGAYVIGVDRADAMRDRAARRFRADLADGRLTLHVASVEKLPLAGGSVDRACSVNALYFWPDLRGAVAELARVLRPGGALLLCFQTPEAVRRWPGHRHGFHAHEVEAVAGAMRAAGLGLAEQRRGRDAAVGEFTCLKGVKQ